MTKLTHLDDQGRVSMVDVSDKKTTSRRAVAEGTVLMSSETFALFQSGENPKGNVETTAELAGIIAAKKTSDLIPLCHPLPLSKVKLHIDPDESLPGVRVTGEVRTLGVTGVEMEALTAVSVACLTIYDMLKASDKGMRITDIALLEKQGGKSGDWVAP
ncbi:MAG: cyclic pyranopterin monophosphate synthase MoaC [Litorimonas sp.]